MKRQMIKINEDRCTGCGICIDACSEGALALVDGKAMLIREDYCDGLGNCLPVCPEDAIEFEVREAPGFVNPHVNPSHQEPSCGSQNVACGCEDRPSLISFGAENDAPKEGELSQWPIQINLVPVKAPWFDGSDLLIAADCTAFAYKDIHEKFIKGRITLIGCPKLDSTDYSEKLSEIIKNNDIKSITLLRMEVPCCSGMYNAVKNAIQKSGKDMSFVTYVFSRKGELLSAQ